MKLRAKFTLLSLFILALPLLSAVLVFFTQRIISGTSPGIRFHGAGNEQLVAEFIRTGDPSSLIERIPKQMEVTIVDAEGRIVASTESGAARGDVFPLNRLAEWNEEGTAAFHYVFESVLSGRTRYTIVTRLPNLPRFIYEGWLPALLLFPIAVVLGTALLSTLMLRKTSRSLQTLKEASVRLASGDLDHTWTVSQRDEIGELSDSFDSMRLSLKEETAKRSRFLMAVTHDLRTPLTSIRGYLEAFADGLAEETESREKYLSIIRDKAGLLENRINEMLDFVKMETGEWKLKLGALELPSFLRELGTGFAEDGRIMDRRFEIDLDLPEDLSIQADAGLLTRVLENLVHNAFRYSDKGDRVEIAARGTVGRVVIEVKDSGRGIAAEERGKVFQPFYRGTRSRNEPGFGLGLSIVKSIVEAHGWAIELDGADGETIFRIRMGNA